jgi:hypothetical protein
MILFFVMAWLVVPGMTAFEKPAAGLGQSMIRKSV